MSSPTKWMMPSLWSGEESLKLSDSSVINLVDDETKLEISLNTAGYQPSELSVNVGDGELVIEGRHQERSQAGEMMVKCSRSNQAVAKVRNTVANQAFLPRTQRRGMRERRTEASIGNSSTTLSTLKKVWPPSKPSTRVKGRP